MRISKIVFTVEPFHQPFKYIELQCTLFIGRKEFHWTEVVEESDFESKFDHYIDYMKTQLKTRVLLEKKEKKNY